MIAGIGTIGRVSPKAIGPMIAGKLAAESCPTIKARAPAATARFAFSTNVDVPRSI